MAFLSPINYVFYKKSNIRGLCDIVILSNIYKLAKLNICLTKNKIIYSNNSHGNIKNVYYVFSVYYSSYKKKKVR